MRRQELAHGEGESQSALVEGRWEETVMRRGPWGKVSPHTAHDAFAGRQAFEKEVRGEVASADERVGREGSKLGPPI